MLSVLAPVVIVPLPSVNVLFTVTFPPNDALLETVRLLNVIAGIVCELPLNFTVLVAGVNVPLLVKLPGIVIVLDPGDNVAPEDILRIPFIVGLDPEAKVRPPVLLTVKLLKVVVPVKV